MSNYTGTKTIQNQIDRALQGYERQKNKWTCIIKDDNFYLYHYVHLLLIFNKSKGPIYQWYQTKTDYRGLAFGIRYLTINFN
jgi:hypothetical protein